MIHDSPRVHGSGPTALRITLGAKLRNLREQKGVTREGAGYHIRSSESKISRIELGRVSLKIRDIEDLLTLYGVAAGATRSKLLALTEEANAPGWWEKYGDVLPSWFEEYVGLERAASLIRSYEVQFVPGLLQTEEYARAVIRLGHYDASDEEIERRVELRTTRQDLFTRSGTPKLWVVVDEAALRRPIGGNEVLAGQIEALIEAIKLPNLILQVMPFRFGGHTATGGAFSVLRFPDPDMTDVVYVEQLTGASYLDKRDDVVQYMTAMDHLCVDSAPPAETVKYLTRILNDL